MDSNQYQQSSSDSSSSLATSAHPFGPITFWGWSTQHNLAYPTLIAIPPFVTKLSTFFKNTTVDICMLWQHLDGTIFAALLRSLKLGTVSCINHYGHINEPTERVSMRCQNRQCPAHLSYR